MNRWLLRIIGLAMALAASVASAEFHTYVIEQVFSDGTGNVQFIVMHESQGMSAEYFWRGNHLTSTHAGRARCSFFPTICLSACPAIRIMGALPPHHRRPQTRAC